MNEPIIDAESKTTDVTVSPRLHHAGLIWISCFLLVMFWDSLLGTVLHLLYYVVEILELSLENILEMLFHLENHDAQIATAWTGVTAFAILGMSLYALIKKVLNSRFDSWSGFELWLKSWARRHWVSLLVAGSAWLTGVFLF